MKTRKLERKKTIGEMTLEELVVRIVFLIVKWNIVLMLIFIAITFFHAIVNVLLTA